MSPESKPLLDALGGQDVWPPPIWLMRQAGRYLPEYRAVRARVSDFVALCTTPELAAEVTLQPIRRFRFDAAILFSDILILPWALGHGLAFREGEGPVLPPLREKEGLAALTPARVLNAVEPVMETVRRVRAGLIAEGFPKTALIGFAGAPFTVACYMVEGSGSRDFAAARKLAYRDPGLFGAILDLLTESTIEYLQAQTEAGAETVMLFDSWAGILPPSQLRAFVIKPARRIVTALRARFPGLPIIGFPRLSGVMIGEYAAETGVNAVAADTATDLDVVMRLVPSTVAVQGNLDPLAVVAGGEIMAEQVRAILKTVRGRPFIFNLGHGVVPETPTKHVEDLVRQVRLG